MEVIIKDIILYDKAGAVQGFVRVCRNDEEGTHFDVGCNFEAGEMLVVVEAGGEMYMVQHEKKFRIEKGLDLDGEVFVSVMRRRGEELIVLASGGVNLAVGAVGAVGDRGDISLVEENAGGPVFKTEAAREVDEILKKACNFEEGGVSACEGCAYRRAFYFQG